MCSIVALQVIARCTVLSDADWKDPGDDQFGPSGIGVRCICNDSSAALPPLLPVMLHNRPQRTHTDDGYSETSETEVEVVVVPHNSSGGRRTTGSQQQRPNPQQQRWPPQQQQQQRGAQSRASGGAAMTSMSAPGGRTRPPGPQQQQQQRLPAGVDFREYQQELWERQQPQQPGPRQQRQWRREQDEQSSDGES
eukprot:GHUV01018661.1.p1 GENE.GHUV01018661.1~~GHUV01018661.1.p1  ORF type:complete len:194 (-),score=75.68 GHUV01018661.1:1306-1887(-)